MEEKNLQKETTSDMRDKIYRFLMKAAAVFAMCAGIIMFCMMADAAVEPEEGYSISVQRDRQYVPGTENQMRENVCGGGRRTAER